MKKYIFLLSLFWAIATTISAQNITRLEYSIDGFVAEGKGTALVIQENSTELNTEFDIDIAGLEPGNHTIHFRAMNEDGVWSFATERSFYIPEPPITEGIVAMEYSIDKMVKEGGGEPLSLQKGTNSIDSILHIDISGLEAGIHNIYMRSKNKLGVWSLPVSKSFVMVKPDTTKIENIKYRFYNDTYKGTWMTALVDPARKNVDSIFMISSVGLDLNQSYTIELYAKNNMSVRSFSAYLNNVILQANNSPERLKDTLKVRIAVNQQMDIKMDTLFADADLIMGDDLMYSIAGINNLELLDFTTWDSNTLLSFSPAAQNSGMYNFWIKTHDLAGDADSLYVDLTVGNPTGIYSTNEQDAFEIYPNPVNEILTIKKLRNIDSGYNLKLHTLEGRLIFVDEVTAPDYRLSLSSYPQGVYIIYLMNNEFAVRKKIIKR
jgi:hypothetical protein